MLIALIISLIIAAIGFAGVQINGNYETKWGYLLVGGLAATCVVMITYVVLLLSFLISLLTFLL